MDGNLAFASNQERSRIRRIRRIPIFVNGKIEIFEKKNWIFGFFDFERSYLSCLNSGSIVNRQNFDPGIEKQMLEGF